MRDKRPQAPTRKGFQGWLIRRNPDFRRFWTGQSISSFGDQVTLIAIPTIAVILLHVSAFMFGLLSAVGYVAVPVVGLLAGAWVDRRSRRKVLIGADAVRLAAVGSMPLAYELHSLSLWILFVANFISGAATCFFSAAYQAYIPSIAPADDIVNANALMAVSNSVAQTAGPSLAGLLIGVVGPARVMVFDAASYGVSVLSIMLIRGQERRPAAPRSNLFSAVRQGVGLVWRHPLLRRLTSATALANIGRGLALELFLLFAYRGLRMTPLTAGLILGAGSAATIIGSAVCRVMVRRLGLGRTLVMACLGKGMPWFLTPLALIWPPVPVLVVITMASSFFIPVWNVNSISLRQYLTDQEVLGRVSATVRTMTSSAVPVAGVLGGALATAGIDLWGNRTGLAVVLMVGGGIWAAAIVMLPVRAILRIRDPEQAVSAFGRISTEPAHARAGGPAHARAGGPATRKNEE